MKTRLLAFLLLSLGATAVFAQPSYQIQKSGAANVRGNSITYTIVVRNHGDAGDATLTDPLPAGTAFVSLTSPAGWSCTTPAVGANGTVTCTNPVFAADAIDTFTLVVDTTGIASGTVVTNTATISGTDVEPRSATATVTLNSTDLRVTKSGSGTTSPGGSITYSIAVVNGGPLDSAATLTDPLPAGTTFTSITFPSGWSCTTPAVGANGTVQCSTGVMAPEESAAFTLTVGMDGSAMPGDVFTNTASVSGPLPDPDPANNSATATTIIPDPAAIDLYVTKSAPSTSSRGGTFHYTIIVGNAGAAVSDATLFDQLPAGTTFQALTQPADWSCTTPAVNTNGAIDCSVATLAGNTAAVFDVTVRVDNSVAIGTVLTNTAEVGTEDPQNNSADDSASASTTIVGVPSTSVSVTDAPDPVVAGQDITYTIDVNNEGPADASDATLTFTPPPSTTFVSVTAPAGWSCTTPAVGASGPTTCTNAMFEVGGATFTVVQHVPSSEWDGSVLTATATIAHSGPDAEPEDDTDSTTTTVVTQATFTVTKSAAATVTAGDDLTYSITVTNDGPSDSDVTLVDNVDAPATFVSLSAPAGWTCTTPAVGATGTVNCSTASLAAAASAPFTLVVNIPAATAAGTVITNTASAGGDSATATTTVVVAQADLQVTKTGPVTTTGNSTVAYTITVTNNGPDAASNVTLTDILTAPFVSLTAPAGWTCTTPAVGATGTVTCSIASLADAAVANFTLSVTAPAGPATLTNTASVTSGTADPNSGNNSATASTAITVLPVAQADVHITKTGPATAVENSTVAYNITVRNDGPDAAANVTLTDVLTAPFVSLAAPAGWTCTTPAVGATGTVTCTIATLANAAVATFTLSVTAPPAPASLTNTAGVTSTTADNDGADNASTAATTITAAPAPAGPAVPTLSPALLALLAMALAAIALRR